MTKTTRRREVRENFCGGQGTAVLEHWLSDGQLCPHLRKAATLILDAGVTMGTHAHESEAEVYLVWQGYGEYVDDGKTVNVGPGDVMVCGDKQSHSLKNTGKEPLVIHEVIITHSSKKETQL
ncbi:MAG: cupin domain-containing protein [Christensenella sp.]|uniref:cupin domain-containing protein n=1 Tax=Christensenella sp. TaxID=1935934 RepID=UPI002B1FD290|nr:cupin domain-containing protein [Christensenella sp.]MEA5001953.1 cupin domain-containing protein [Christensenella sp.]